MGVLFFVSLHPLTLSPLHHHRQPSSFPPKPTCSILSSQTLSIRSLLIFSKSFTARSSSRENQPDEPSFLDKDGVVEDMDGYLNYLSLEYDSVWDTKPSWCQPWTILLTGVTVVTCSWLFLHSVIVSAGVLFIISAWWYIFLYVYPKAYAEMIAERRKKVTTGVEDTFGLRKSQ